MKKKILLLTAVALMLTSIFVINSAFTKKIDPTFPAYDEQLSKSPNLFLECNGSGVTGGTCTASCRDGCNCSCNSTAFGCTCSCSDCPPHAYMESPELKIITINPRQYDNWKTLNDILVADNSLDAETAREQLIEMYNFLRKGEPADPEALDEKLVSLFKTQSQEVREKFNELFERNNSSIRV